MLQVICNTSGTLKICPNLTSIFPPLYIVTGTRCDCGLYFIVVMTFLHGSAGNCGFTTTFYKAAGLINGQKKLTNRVDYVDTLSHTVNRLFLSREKLTSDGVFGLILASKLPWTRKANILRLVTKYIFQLQIKINLEN